MLTVYVRDGAVLRPAALPAGGGCPEGAVWIDLVAPSAEEIAQAETLCGLDLPDRDQRHDLAPSARLRFEDDVLTLTTTVAADSASEAPLFGPVTFVLTRAVLVTVREHDPSFMRTFAKRVQTIPGLTVTPIDALIDILETLVDRAADVLAMIAARIDSISRETFSNQDAGQRAATPPETLSRTLGRIGRIGEFLARLREGLYDLDRIPPHLIATIGDRLSRPEQARVKSLVRDIRGLTQLSDSHVQRCSFLMDSAVGLISIGQNHAMRVYTVIATALMAPTLIASTYGMNFENMPELKTQWGYYVALAAMVVAGVVPLLWFKRKGWM